jgi:hypothetical protein
MNFCSFVVLAGGILDRLGAIRGNVVVLGWSLGWAILRGDGLRRPMGWDG